MGIWPGVGLEGRLASGGGRAQGIVAAGPRSEAAISQLMRSSASLDLNLGWADLCIPFPSPTCARLPGCAYLYGSGEANDGNDGKLMETCKR
jgi:hypothetical protein